MSQPHSIDRTALSLTLALVWAGYVGVVGIMARLGWGERWRLLLSDVYIGFDETTAGIGIGVLWAAIDGFVGGWLLATVYNILARRGHQG